MAHWSRLGKLKRQKCPSLSGGGGSFGGGAGPGMLAVMAGVLMADTYLAARELVREVDFTLTTLAGSLLGQQRFELPAAEVPGKWPALRLQICSVQHAAAAVL